jgi:outer membrane receptor protein involved in Fe transport
MPTLREAVRCALHAGVAVSMLHAASAFAADGRPVQRVEAGGLDKVIAALPPAGAAVRSNRDARPLLEITRFTLSRFGFTSIGELLQELSVAGSALNAHLNAGGDGSTAIDLRGLGAERVLVLVDGRRWVPGLAGAVDVNSIPIPIVEKIEILKDGASAVHGSGAIAGVVNIITRKELDRLEASATLGAYDRGDGGQQLLSVSYGATAAKTSVFLNASYTRFEPVHARDREVSSEPVASAGLLRGSSASPRGRFHIYGGVVSGGSRDLTLCDAVAESNPAFGCNVAYPGFEAWYAGDATTGEVREDAGVDAYDFASAAFLAAPQQRTSLYAKVTHDLTDGVAVNAEMLYAHRESRQELAAEPLVIGGAFANPTTPQGEMVVSSTNPYNPFGFRLVSDHADWIASGGFYYSADAYLVQAGRRLVELGDRIDEQDVETRAFRVGLEGGYEAMGRYFDWSLSYGFTDDRRVDLAAGVVDYLRVQQALGDSIANPLSPTGFDCLDSDDGSNSGAVIAGCVPLDLFGGPGSIGPEMAGWIAAPGIRDRYGYTVRDYAFEVSGDALDLPAGPVALKAGYEHRVEDGYDRPDALLLAGTTTAGQRSGIAGGRAIDELGVQLDAPLLVDAPWVRYLAVDAAARAARYDDLDRTATAARVGFRWRPFEELLVRGSYSEGFRAPSLLEVYRPGVGGLTDVIDPCNGVDVGDPLEVYCGDNGVTVDGSFAQNGVPIPIVRSGNPGTIAGVPGLAPETSSTTTIGLVWKPASVEGLTLSLDRYRIAVDGVIDHAGEQAIVDGCASSWDAATQSGSFCALVGRDGTGQVVGLQDVALNLGRIEVAGVDLSALYLDFELPLLPGSFSGGADLAYVSSHRRDGIELAGTNQGRWAAPELKASLALVWIRGDWGAAWRSRFISGQDEACFDGTTGATSLRRLGLCNLEADTTTVSAAFDQAARNRIGGTAYHDLQLSYRYSEADAYLTFGVRNLFDKEPPLSRAAPADSFDATTYEVPGRFVYLRVAKQF